MTGQPFWERDGSEFICKTWRGTLTVQYREEDDEIEAWIYPKDGSPRQWVEIPLWVIWELTSLQSSEETR